MCVCSEVKRIHNSSIQGEDEYFYLKDDIEKFLSQLHTLLSKSRGISRDLKYQVKCKRSISQDRSNRAAPIFEADFDDTRQKFLYDQWKEDPQRFWTPESTPFKPTGDAQISLLQDPIYSALNDFLRSDQNEVHQILHRRVTSIVVHILSRVVPDKYGGGSITTKFHQAKLFPDVSECDLRKTIHKLDNHGKTWISIGHRLGAGAIWSLPWNVPLSA